MRSESPLKMDLGPLARPADWLAIVNASYLDFLVDYYEV